MDTFEHDMYFAHEKPIHLTPIWSPDVDGDDDDVRPETHRKNLEKGSPASLRFRPQNVPENWSKSTPRLDPFLDPFLVQFRGRFWADFGCHLGPKTGPGEV